jgi:alpha-L-rhamnosidase
MKKYIGSILLQFVLAFAYSEIRVGQLVCENLINPIGIGIQQPQFGWQIVSDKRNVMQSAYEIRSCVDSGLLAKGKNLQWNTGKIQSDQSVYIVYNGEALQSAKKYFWQVRVWDNMGNVSQWSEPSFWQMGLLHASDWEAKWIKPGFAEDSLMRPSPLFRKGFTILKKIQSATAFITAHGLYEAYINGKRIGDAYLTPGWTSYNKRLQYQAYDVTTLLQINNNVAGAILGSGWYRGNLVWEGRKDFFGKELGLLFQIQIVYTDGSTETIVTDESWRSSVGAILSSEIYHGEINDAREEKTGWMMTNYDDKNWYGVSVQDYDKNVLVATYNEPVRKHEIFKPLRIFKTPLGEQVIDFGQNLVGFVQVKVSGKEGDRITIYHAEVLDKAGNFYTANLRSAKQRNVYVLNGKGDEIFEPHFTFQGFRYIKIEGFPGEIRPENITAVALYSDMKPTGYFSTSNALLNQLQHNIQWGQKGNFLDIPTDCPQRDERLGWTGDAQVFSRTAVFNMQGNNFFTKWLKDVAADQFPDGRVPHVIPNVLGSDGGATGWADVATIIPWNLYLAYGNKRILEDQYASMKAWAAYMVNNSENDLWNKGSHFGDWLFYSPEDDVDGMAAVTDKFLIAQCFFAHSIQLCENAATVLGNTKDVFYYSKLLRRIKNAFVKEYVTSSGRLVSGTQTAYVLALNFDMFPENLRKQAAKRLVANIENYDNHLSTGFLGTPYICHVLTKFGYDTVAYKLLLQETYPSWLYPVKMGATTIWERWDGQKPDSSFETPGMNSFNHYAYGSIGDWMYRVIAGIDTYEDMPGYKHIRIMPHIGGNLSFTNADLLTNYGLVSSHWKIINGQTYLDVDIPANTRATVYIPTHDDQIIKEGGTLISNNSDIKLIGKEGGYVKVEVGSGKYRFTME